MSIEGRDEKPVQAEREFQLKLTLDEIISSPRNEEMREKAQALQTQIDEFDKFAHGLEPLAGGTFMGTLPVFSEVPDGYEKVKGVTPVRYVPMLSNGPGTDGKTVHSAAIYIPIGSGITMRERLEAFLSDRSNTKDILRRLGSNTRQ